MVTVPAIIIMSAWRGDGRNTSAPKRAMSKRAAAVAIKIFPDAGGEFVGDPRAQGLSDIDVFAGDLDLHEEINAPLAGWCQSTAV